jgi:hypothetical protein
VTFVIPGKLCLSSLLALTLYMQVKHPALILHSSALNFLVSMLWLWTA